MAEMKRNWSYETVTVDATAADSSQHDMSDMAGGSLIIPAGATTQTYNVQAAEEIGSTFYDLYDKDGTQVTMAVQASRVYELPTAVYGCGAIRFHAQTGDESGSVILFKKG